MSAARVAERILVAGIGNIFLGDDAFGVEVAQRLLQRPPIEGVRVVDFGIRGLDLSYALLEGYEAVILVDAVPRGRTPGTLYVIEPDPVAAAAPAAGEMNPNDVLIDSHNMDPVKVLRLAATLGGMIRRVLVVGCEPTPFNAEDDMQMALSAAVEAAVGEAVTLVESLVKNILSGGSWPPASSVGPISIAKGEMNHEHTHSTF